MTRNTSHGSLVWWRRVHRYLGKDIWEQDTSSLGRFSGFLLRTLQVGSLVWRNFKNDALSLQASALTFTSLMSLVPLLALIFSILNGLGYSADVTAYLSSLMDQMPAQFQGFVDDILHVVQNTNFARLGGIGGVLLLLIVVQMLGKIEGAFNRVWHVTRHRSMLQKVAQYISIVVVVPIMFAAGVTLTARLQFGDGILEHLGVLRLAPTLATCLALLFLYVYMPNIRVKFVPALISSLVAAILWQLWLQFYIIVQPGVTKLNVLYGTLASVPIFLAWLYVNWVIVLLGAEICFAVQNHAMLKQQKTAQDATARLKLKLSVLMLSWCARALHGKHEHLSRDVFLARYPVPLDLFHDTIGALVDDGFLAETIDDPERYVLLKAPDEVTLADVVRSLLDYPAGETQIDGVQLDEKLDSALNDLDASLSRVLSERTVADLV